MRNVAIIGIGRVGGALAIALSSRGYNIRKLFVRADSDLTAITSVLRPETEILRDGRFEEITEDIVFVTTQDDAVGDVAKILEQKLTVNGRHIFHTSGALSSDVFDGLRQKGNQVGSIHPLVSVSDPIIGAEKFGSAYFCVEGDQKSLTLANSIVRDLEGIPFTIEAKYKPLYHAAAVTSCGHFVALLDLAVRMLSKCGIERDDGKKILIPLIESTLKNASEQPLEDALTGPFPRADTDTLKKHIEMFDENMSKDDLIVYALLGKLSLDLASFKNQDFERIGEMRRLLADARIRQ